MRVKERRTLSEIQGLVGTALGCYMNDRDPNRAESVMMPLKKAFDLCVAILGEYPPVDLERQPKPCRRGRGSNP
jgi:hypothetical protein